MKLKTDNFFLFSNSNTVIENFIFNKSIKKKARFRSINEGIHCIRNEKYTYICTQIHWLSLITIEKRKKVELLYFTLTFFSSCSSTIDFDCSFLKTVLFLNVNFLFFKFQLNFLIFSIIICSSYVGSLYWWIQIHFFEQDKLDSIGLLLFFKILC